MLPIVALGVVVSSMLPGGGTTAVAAAARVVKTGFMATDGIIHVIDGIILPAER